MRPLAVQLSGVVVALLHGGVESRNGVFQSIAVNAQLLRQAGNRVGLGFGHLRNVVLIPQQVLDLVVEYLHGHAHRLAQDLAAVFGVGVITKIRALVDETTALGVDDDAEGIGVLLIQLRDGTVTGRRRVQVPGNRVTAAPMAVRLRSDVQRHANAVPGVVGDAADFGQFPTGPQVTRAHLRVRLKAAAGENDRLGLQVLEPLRPLHRHARYAALLILQQPYSLGAIANYDAHAFRRFELLVGQTLAGAYRLHQ